MTPNKDIRILVRGAGAFTGGHLVDAFRRQGFMSLLAVEVEPLNQWCQWFDDKAGFILEAFDVEGPTEVELEQLDKVKIHRSFAAYSREGLAATHLFFVARKP